MESSRPFSFDIKRDDLIDPIISGNKWRKLEYNLLKAQQLNKEGILTFGGPYSNHLIATAKAANLAGLKAIGIVRGEELNKHSNITLKTCSEFGMELKFISRSAYREYHDNTSLEIIKNEYPRYHVVPEGGRNFYGVIGCQHILNETENDYDHIYLAGGTGTTAAGVLLSCPEKTTVHLVSALKGGFLEKEVESLLSIVLNDELEVSQKRKLLIVENDAHFGGYGKVTKELLDFINKVFHLTGLKLDPIYTGKAFYKMVDDFTHERIALTDKVLFIHTGGIQGARSWEEEIDYFKK